MPRRYMKAILYSEKLKKRSKLTTHIFGIPDTEKRRTIRCQTNRRHGRKDADAKRDKEPEKEKTSAGVWERDGG